MTPWNRRRRVYGPLQDGRLGCGRYLGAPGHKRPSWGRYGRNYVLRLPPCVERGLGLPGAVQAADVPDLAGAGIHHGVLAVGTG